MNRTKQPALINTPLQRGVWGATSRINRFNGFSHGVETLDPDNREPYAGCSLWRTLHACACSI
ncbi:MAG: hypothetical protein NTW03_21360 [Verrucomicrobia bacterium]|nr:hypothetical protein [Verrucomicrobiota bacterium]